MADNVEVKLGADTAAAQSSFDNAASSIAASLAGIQKALEGMTQTHAKVTPAIEKNNNAIVRSFKEMQTQISGAYEGIQRAAQTFNGVMVGLSVLLAGGALWRESVGQMLHFEQEVLNLENVMGMLSDKATQTAVALKIIGSSSDAYTGIALKMGRQLKSGGEEMERLGVVTKDAAGNLLPMDTIMQNAFARMQTFKAGTDQAEFALSVFGRSVQDVYNIMARLPAAQERAKELMHDLGIEMGPERQAEIERYRLSVGSFSVVLEEIGVKIGEAVLPNLEGLASWFNERGPAAVNAVVTAFKLIPQAFEYISAGFQRILANLAYLSDDFVDSAKTLWKKLVAITTTGGETLVQIQAAYNKRRLDNEKKFADELVAIDANMHANLALLDKKETGGKPGPGPMGSGPNTFTAKPTAGSGKEESVMGYLEGELKARQDAFNQMKLDQGSFETWSAAQTKAYWADILTSTLLSSKDRLAATNKFYDAKRTLDQQQFAAHVAGIEKEIAAAKYSYDEQIRLATQLYNDIVQRYGLESAAAEAAAKKIIEIRQKQADQIAKIADLQAKMEMSASAFEVAMAEASLQQQVALRRVGSQEMFQVEADLENRLYALNVESLAKKRAAATGDIVKQKELDEQLQTLEQQHQTKLTQIANQAELDRQQFAIQASEAVEASFGTLLNDLVSRTKTLKQTFLDFTKSLTDSLNRIASQQIAKQLFGAGTEGGGAVSSLMSKIFGGGATGGGGNTGTTAADAALKKLATTTQTTTSDFSAISTVSSSTMTPAFSAVTDAAYQAATALQSVASSSGGSGAGGGGGMFGSLFDSIMGGGDSGGLGGFDAVAGYEVGTNYVPKDQLALVHRGEMIVPASMNPSGKSSRAMGGMTVNNHFVIQGGIDGRTQDQMASKVALATQRASYRNL